jgi:hypothetical protein
MKLCLSTEPYFLFPLVEWATFISPIAIFCFEGKLNNTYMWQIIVLTLLLLSRCIYISVRHATTPESEYLRTSTYLISAQERLDDEIL